ncbi:DUF433 domain-containing protein [Methylopila sp. M107]|uniref:DUF433 domain-containing protein n=1 Tax=Methylopila sp. M107 TaxID=1101190 RepID=UPI00037DAA08|nr:DUF433 domain-containing protein [Methylopila sp. M107]
MVETLDDIDDFLADAAMEHPRISQDPKVMVGKPVIRGTRVTVEVLLSLLGSGMTVDEVAEQYPHISRDDVLAAQRFAADYLARTKGRPVAAE